MAVNHKITQYYSNFRGLDLSVDDISRDPRFATEAQNVRIESNGTIAKRKGFKLQNDTGSYALIAFAQTDPTSGIITDERLIITDDINREKKGTITVSNTIGNGQPLSIDISGDATTNNFVITLTFSALIDDLGNETVAESQTTINLGDVTTTASQTIAQAITSMSAISGISAVATAGDDTAVTAVSLELTEDTQITDGSDGTLNFYYEEAITHDSGADLSLGHANFKLLDTGEHLSHAVFNRSLFLTNGFDNLLQYDGHTYYRAGMSKHPVPTGVTGAAGALTGDYKYKIVTRFKDINGAFHTADISEESAIIAPTADMIDLTVTNIEDGLGFDARGALADGNQSNSPSGGKVTLAVSDNTAIAGDVIYLLNRDVATNAFAEYTVDSVTASTIVVNSTVDIDLNDNDIISSGIRHEIHRTKAGGDRFFLVAEIPNDYTTATQTYTDNDTDATIEANGSLIIPSRVRGLPPKARYVTTYKNVLILGHERSNPNIVHHSEPDEPTNFPILNNFLVEADSGGVISAVKESNEALVIFKRDAESIFTMTGDLVNRRIRVDRLTNSVGCQSHASIVDVNGALFFLSEKGVYSMVGAGIPQLMSRPINQLITKVEVDPTKVLKTRRAISAHNKNSKEYIVFIPAEDTTGGLLFANASSKLFVFDYFNDNWSEWKNVNCRSGIIFSDNTIYFASRQLDLNLTSVVTHVFRMHRENLASDYGDQTQAIEFRYASGWETRGNPSMLKKFLRIKIHSIERAEEDLTIVDFTLTVLTERDFNYDRPHSTLTASFPDRGETWDSKPWDFFTWGGFQQTSFRSKLRSGTSKAMRVVLENTEYAQNVKVTGFELEIAEPQRTTIKE